jgi:bifunctional DNA-binding transcriptional regulator/antitoxin component of YhaV-PrlF toxin-antitoxin module
MTKLKPKDLCKVGQNGRVTIKKVLREKKGIEVGDLVYINVYKVTHITAVDVEEMEVKKENGSRTNSDL